MAGDWSDSYDFTTAPNIPSGLSLTSQTETSVSLLWNCNTTNVTGYNIYRDSSLIGTSTTPTYTDSTVTAGNNYSYCVRAYDSDNNLSDASDSLSVSVIEDSQAPTAPTNLTCTDNVWTNVVLSWTASTDNTGVTGYKVYRDGFFLANTELTTYTDTGASRDTTHVYSVRAFDINGNLSDSSSGLSVTTVLDAPENVHITSSTTSTVVNVAWNTVTGAVSYSIEVDSGMVYNTSSTNYSISGLATNALHSVRVRANTGTVNGSWSAPYSFSIASGTISQDTTWGANGIYIIKSAITISSNITLTIEDGVKIYVVGTVGVTVNGTLNISGMETNCTLISSIKDTSLGGPGTTYWGGITIGTTGSVNANYLTLGYGKITTNGDLDLTNSTVSNCSSYGIYSYLTSVSDVIITDNSVFAPIYIRDSGYNSFTVEDNIITNTAGPAFYIALAGTAVNNDIYSDLINNDYSGCLYKGIRIGGTMTASKTLPTGLDYFITTDVQVNSNAALTVSGGISIYIVGTPKITVNGNLYVQGTSSSPVLVTSVGTTNWGGITIGTTGAVDADYLTLGYGKITANGDLSLTNSTVSNCSSYGVYTYLTSVSDVTITGNNFTAPIFIRDSGRSSFTVNNNTITCTTNSPFYVDLAGTAANYDLITGLTNNSFSGCLYNGIRIGGTMTADKTLPAVVDYYMSNAITVNSGVTLTLSPGTNLYVIGNMTITANGTLNMPGTSSDPVLITSVGTTNWGGITIGTTGTVDADYLTLGYGKITANGDLELTNSTVSNCSTYGVYANLTPTSDINITGNDFLAPIHIKDGGRSSFTVINNTITCTADAPFYVDLSGTFADYDIYTGLANNSFSGCLYNGIKIGGTLTAGKTLPAVSDYYMSSAITVKSGVNLTLSPGTNLYVIGNLTITANGTLNMPGTSSDPVLITSVGTTNWGGITIGTTGAVDADYLTLGYGKITANGDLELTNSTVSNCSTYGVYANLTPTSDINITGNDFLAPIHIKDGGRSSFTVINNTITCTADAPFYVDLSGTFADYDIYTGLANNSFSGCLYNGIKIGGTMTAGKTLPAVADYYMSSAITVNSDITLNIADGANIYVIGTPTITVNGILNMTGTALSPILLTSINDVDLGGAGTTYWGGILISATGFVNAGYINLRYGKIVDYGALSLTNSTISNCNTNGLSLYLTASSVVTVTDNTIAARVFIQHNGYDTFVIEDNTISNPSGYPFYIDLSGTETSNIFIQYLYNNNNTTGCLNSGMSIGGILSQSFTIPYYAGNRYSVESNIVVSPDVTLTIEPGVVMLMGYNVGITVNGTFISEASENQNTVITYYKDANYGGTGVTFTYASNDLWSGINATASGIATGTIILDHTEVLYYKSSSCVGNFSADNSHFMSRDFAWNFDVTSKTISVENCNITTRCDGIRISADDSLCTVSGNTFLLRLAYKDFSNPFQYAITINKAINMSEDDFSISYNSLDISEFTNMFPMLVDLNNFNSFLFEHQIYSNDVIFDDETKPLNLMIVKGGSITSDKRLSNSFETYMFLSDLVIGSSSTLDVDQGITMVMKGDDITVNGILNLNGEQDSRINIIPYRSFQWRDNTFVPNFGLWDGITVNTTGTANILCTTIAICDFADQDIKNAITVYGRLNLLGSAIYYFNTYYAMTSGYFIKFDTPIMPELHYNYFLSAFGESDYIGRKNREDLAFINERAATMTIDAGENIWGKEEGAVIFEGASTYRNNCLLMTEGFDLGTTILDKKSFGQTSSASGNFSAKHTDMQFAAPGFTVDFTRTYNSRSDEDTGFGTGWTLNVASKAEVYYYDKPSGEANECVVLSLPNGSVVCFNGSEGVYTSDSCRHSLVKNASGGFVLTTKDHFVYTYNSAGNLISMADKNGNTITIQVDSNGLVQSVTDSAGRVSDIHYNDGKITSIEDFSGREVEYDYDAQGRLASVTDPSGNVSESYTYNAQGLLTEVKNGLNQTLHSVTYIYNENPCNSKMHTYTDSNGKTVTYSYDMTNRITTKTDQNNKVTKDYFNENNFIIQTDDAANGTTVTEYHNDYGDVKSVTDRNGNKTQYTVDTNGNVTKITNPDNSYKQMTYDVNNNITSLRDENGKMSYYVYDSNNNVLKCAQPLDGTTPYTAESNDADFAITSYVYYTDAECQTLGYLGRGLVKTETDPNGTVAEYEYNAYGFATEKTISGTGSVTTYTYNQLGWCLSETSAEGVVKEYDYDDNGNLLRQTVDGDKVTRYVYDSANRQTQVISPNDYDSSDDGLNNLIFTSYTYSDSTVGERYTYNAAGLATSHTDAEDNTNAFAYDVYGNTVTQTLPSGGIYIGEYDSLNRQTAKKYKENSASPAVLTESYSYEILASKQTLKTSLRYFDAESYSTVTETYDYADRVVESVDADGTVSTTTYNANGTVASKTIGSYREYYTYDGLNRAVQMWSSSSVSGSTYSYAYASKTYDKNGNTLTESVGDSYVAQGVVPASLTTTTYTYSPTGLITSVSDANGVKLEYVYDDDGNLLSEEKHTSANESLLTEFTYDTAGNISEKTQHLKAGDLSGGTFGDSGDAELDEAYTYDLNGNLLTVTNAAGTVFSFTYDSLNRQLSDSVLCADETGTPVTTTVSRTFTWDGQISTETDALDNTTGYIYTNNCLLSMAINAAGGVTKYWYDTAGRLTATVTPQNYSASAPLSGMAHTEYAYDNSDRVITESETVWDEDEEEFVTYVEKAFAYDELGNAVKELDALGYAAGTGTEVGDIIDSGYGMEFTYDLIGRKLTATDPVSADRSLTAVSFTYDTFNRVKTKTDAAGTITTYTYDIGGNVLSTTVQAQGGTQKTIATATYDRIGRMLTATDGNGNTTEYQYNAFGEVRQINHPYDDTIGEYIEYFQYNALGKLTRAWDSCDAETLYTYDSLSRVLTATERKTDATQSITTQNKYDKCGNLRYEYDGNGNATAYTYNAVGNVLTATAGGHTTTYTYDADGNALTATDWLGNVSTNVYDSLSRLTEQRDAFDVAVQKYVYNNNGAVTSSFDAFDYETVYWYDKDSRLLSTTD